MTFLRSLTLALVVTAAAGCGPAVPEPLAAEVARTPPGIATIIDFVDFQCPFCRRNHEALAPLLSTRRDKLRIVRKHVPLRRHENALPAALAAVCAEAQGKGDEMADALLAAPVPRLRTEGCEDMAVELGLDIDRYRTCVTAPATTAHIHEDEALFASVGGHGLPLLFIGGERLVGLQSEETLERALDEAVARAKR